MMTLVKVIRQQSAEQGTNDNYRPHRHHRQLESDIKHDPRFDEYHHCHGGHKHVHTVVSSPHHVCKCEHTEHYRSPHCRHRHSHYHHIPPYCAHHHKSCR